MATGLLTNKILGTIRTLFRIKTVALKDNSGVLEVRDKGDTTYNLARAADIPTSGANVKDLVNLLNLKARVTPISFAFDGASPPSPGDNTGTFGICHTTGGSYTVSQIFYDTGAALQRVSADAALHITIKNGLTVSGTISLTQNCFYAWEGGAWVLKGDGAAAGIGLEKTIALDITYSSTTVASTATIPDGAVVDYALIDVATAFDGTTPTVSLVVAGSSDATLLATSDQDLTEAEAWNGDIPPVEIDATTTGPVEATVTTSGASAGAARIYVHYTTPQT